MYQQGPLHSGNVCVTFDFAGAVTKELSLAEEVIEDITTSKLVGLRRFFEHYDLPAVSLSLLDFLFVFPEQKAATRVS